MVVTGLVRREAGSAWLIITYGSIVRWVTELYSQTLADHFIRELGESRNRRLRELALCRL